MQVARNVMVDPRLVPGGGATEMALAHALKEKAKSVAGVQQWPYHAVGRALEVIPRTLLQNCGTNTIRVLTALRVSRFIFMCKGTTEHNVIMMANQFPNWSDY